MEIVGLVQSGEIWDFEWSLRTELGKIEVAGCKTNSRNKSIIWIRWKR